MSVSYKGPIIDVHTHLMLDAQMQMVDASHPPDSYIAAADGLDVRHVGALAIAPSGDLDRCRIQNDRVLELSTVSPMFYAAASIHPHDGEAALAEIDRVAQAGVRTQSSSAGSAPRWVPIDCYSAAIIRWPCPARQLMPFAPWDSAAPTWTRFSSGMRQRCSGSSDDSRKTQEVATNSL